MTFESLGQRGQLTRLPVYLTIQVGLFLKSNTSPSHSAVALHCVVIVNHPFPGGMKNKLQGSAGPALTDWERASPTSSLAFSDCFQSHKYKHVAVQLHL